MFSNKYLCFNPDCSVAITMSLRFENPSSFIVAGPSGVGKTFWVLQFVNSLKDFRPEIERVVYHYKIWQELYRGIKATTTQDQTKKVG